MKNNYAKNILIRKLVSILIFSIVQVQGIEIKFWNIKVILKKIGPGTPNGNCPNSTILIRII